MVEVRYANAMCEVLEYLKGIRDEDVAKISKKFLAFLEENASKDFECKFDYNKPLSELEISPTAKSIIGLIYYNFWCETVQQKNDFLSLLDDNDRKYQKELNDKYNVNNIFDIPHKTEGSNEKLKNNTEKAMIVKKDLKWYERVFEFVKKLFKK